MRAPDARGGAGGWTLPGYTQERELGRGDSGRVVAAVEKATGRRVAIRYLSAALVGDDAFMVGFRAAAQRLAGVDVPSAARVYGFAEQPGAGAAVVMELISGVTLAALIERRGPLAPEAALAVLKGMLLALAAVHRLGFGHGDCKPGSVLVDEAGQVSVPGCVRSARDLTDLALRSCGYPDDCAARILVSVLVIASLLHADPSAGEPVAVTVTVLPGRLHVDVTCDGSDGWPAPRRVLGEAAETCGSSLRLVDQLSDAWVPGSNSRSKSRRAPGEEDFELARELVTAS